MQPLIMKFSPASSYFIPFGPKYLPQHPFTHPQANALPFRCETKFQTNLQAKPIIKKKVTVKEKALILTRHIQTCWQTLSILLQAKHGT